MKQFSTRIALLYALLIFTGIPCESIRPTDNITYTDWEDGSDDPLEAEFIELEKIFDQWPPPDLNDLVRLSPQQVIALLLNLNPPVQELLLENFYLFTHPLNKRYLLDIPGFRFKHRPTCGKELMLQGFLNQTTSMNFTKDANTIDSYIDLLNPNTIRLAQQFILDFDVPFILSLFTNTKIQQRRSGLFFGMRFNRPSTYFSFKAPLYYLERNFFLTREERLAIERTNLFDQDDETIEQFTRDHLVVDEFGLGDTRLTMGFVVKDDECITVNVGTQLTVPTAWTLRSAILGSHFKKQAPRPIFDLEQIFCLALDPDPAVNNPELALELTNNFVLGALDRLSANLLQTQLGNGGHLGLIGFFESQWYLNDSIHFDTRSALEYLLPAFEDRFYILNPDAQAVLGRNYQDPNLAPENIDFINQQIINKFYPFAFKTLITPGFIFKFTTSFNYHVDDLELRVGYDLWWQQQEIVGKIKKVPLQLQGELQKELARKPGAIQQKVLASLQYHSGAKHEWMIGLYADKTFLASGIGKDVTLSLQSKVNF